MKHLITILCALCVLCGSSDAAPKPNFIVILADDMGYGDLACYGAKDIATPHIDQMAREGAKFTSCCVAPVCSPTRASLNTATGGKAGPLKGGKGSTLEGGVRVPFVARWPRNIPAGTVSDAAITIMDLLPTLTQLAGGDVPQDRVIDGKDIWPLLAGKPDAKSPHEAIYYLLGRGVDGVRVGDWKYTVGEASEKEDPKLAVELTAEEKILPRTERKALIKERSKAASRKPAPSPALYHLGEDLGEQDNLIAKHPEIVGMLKKRLEDFRKEIIKHIRPAGIANQP